MLYTSLMKTVRITIKDWRINLESIEELKRIALVRYGVTLEVTLVIE
jgi:hypothetical protein